MVDCFWLEIPDFVFNQLAVGSLSSKVIYTFFDFVTLKISKEQFTYFSLNFLRENSLLFDHSASRSLVKVIWCLSSNQLDLNHFFSVKLI